MMERMTMHVDVITATKDPLDLISAAAGTCYGKPNASHKRALRCFKDGHLSVFEHASATFKIEGISRACMAQLTRHRHASLCVESQRYCRYDLEGSDWYVIPEAFTAEALMDDLMLESWYRKKVEADAKAYREALEAGVRPEDARYLLPEATKTNLTATMNVRELFHFFDMRLDKAAQWEVRQLASSMKDELVCLGGQWESIMAMYDGYFL